MMMFMLVRKPRHQQSLEAPWTDWNGEPATMTAMVSLDTIGDVARAFHLSCFGALHPETGELDAGTVVLLGPDEPGFWSYVAASDEFRDGRPDPLDRWSRRVLTEIADRVGATPLFPFEGPPWYPFVKWAKATGRAWESPVSLLVHDQAGLMVSYRGALAFKRRLDLPRLEQPHPCDTCERPCETACPVGALSSDGYDLAACHAYLDTEPGLDCLENGCAVRRSCPISQSYGRRPEQSAFHMRHFHP